ncbi:methylamine utilization protein [Pseudomonas sp. 1928-m]|uniref:methylamine utilization protein n=1 Tax=Pseudomonas sp. 1928-m TaxID=3033804 RepID=UPI0023DF7BE6|nr:methylamine utilization protein [Pseudomonas sp. 1928-m]MDF3196383.1 methylamine utilization protein [Pseudomonas sp. 1928-m]
MSKHLHPSFTFSLLGILLLSTPLHAASLQAELVDSQGQPLANAVLSLRSEVAPVVAPATAVMDQRSQQFAPNVLAVRSGTSVSFPNSDNIRHHVYSFSLAKRFELRLYQGTPSEPVIFDKPGVVVLGCNIHDWMVGYVYVTDDPWFAVSDAQGKLNLEQLPAGTYTASLWHPQAPDMLPQAAGQVQLTEAGSQQRFTLTMQAPASQAAPSAPASAFGDAFKKARDAAQ